MPKLKNETLLLFAAVVAILFYLLPLVIFGENTYALIYDNLDSYGAYYKILAESGKVFFQMDSTIPNIMGDFSRNIYPSEFNVITWLYLLFTPFQAYVINQILQHCLAFLGMYLLLRRHFLREDRDSVIAVGVSLAFALLPFYPLVGLSVAGQPLALYAFLNIHNRSYAWTNWLIIILVPFYASFVLAFVFFLCAMGLLWLYDLIVKRKLNILFVFSIFLMGSVFLLVEYRLVYLMFFDNSFVSHRSAYSITGYPIGQRLLASIYIFIFGHVHAASLQQYFIGISVALALMIIFYKKSFSADRLLIILLIITAVISLWYGFWAWGVWTQLREKVDILRTFEFSRFHWLYPLLWYLIFALALCKIAQSIRWGKAIVLLLIMAQCVFLFYSSNWVSEFIARHPTYSQFYSVGLFEDIKNYIGADQDSYRVASIGLHPSVAQYNGFYTVDGFLPNYPLEYKKQFRKIIEKELEKNPGNAAYFDDWGSKAYIFVAELPRDFMITKDSKYAINNLQLNIDAFKQMGGKYIFSTVPINNASDIGLRLEKEFTDTQVDYWLSLLTSARQYLYRAQSSQASENVEYASKSLWKIYLYAVE